MIWKLLDGAEHGIIKVKGTLSCSILGKYQNIKTVSNSFSVSVLIYYNY
jgi:hypothetical protein